MILTEMRAAAAVAAVCNQR